MPLTTAASYWAANEEVLHVYRMGGLFLVEIRCDNQFQASMNRIAA